MNYKIVTCLCRNFLFSWKFTKNHQIFIYNFQSRYHRSKSHKFILTLTFLSCSLMTGRVVAAATHRTLTPGPCVRAVQRCTVARCTAVHTGSVHLYTAPTRGWGDVFEFIINCMSPLNIAHARHCSHRDSVTRARNKNWELRPGR